MKQKLVFFSFVIYLIGFSNAYGFPELIRHGYVNCISCHVSPTGGGTLTPYGRQLSREILSQNGKEGEEQFFYGLFSSPEWFNGGGDFRGIQFYRNNAQVSQAGVIPMQADLELSVNLKGLSADSTLGPQERPISDPAQGTLFSRRHYLKYQFDDFISLRAGRFFPSYGINTPDHVIVTKRNLGWDENGESYNLELAYLGDKFNLYGTGIFGRPDNSLLNKETGAALTSSYFLGDGYKIGLSYYYGTNNADTRHLYGPWGILGFSKHLFLLSEFDFQNFFPKASGQSSQTGFVNYQRFNYEIAKGTHIFLNQEYSQLDFQNSQSVSRIYGLGIQYFPRPHFEIQIVWTKRQTISVSSDYEDYAWLLAHFYP